jgi:hypothetical protein
LGLIVIKQGGKIMAVTGEKDRGEVLGQVLEVMQFQRKMKVAAHNAMREMSVRGVEASHSRAIGRGLGMTEMDFILAEEGRRAKPKVGLSGREQARQARKRRIERGS